MAIARQSRMGQRYRAARDAEVSGIIEHDHARAALPVQFEEFLILAQDRVHENVDFQRQLVAALANTW